MIAFNKICIHPSFHCCFTQVCVRPIYSIFLTLKSYAYFYSELLLLLWKASTHLSKWFKHAIPLVISILDSQKLNREQKHVCLLICVHRLVFTPQSSLLSIPLSMEKRNDFSDFGPSEVIINKANIDWAEQRKEDGAWISSAAVNSVDGTADRDSVRLLSLRRKGPAASLTPPLLFDFSLSGVALSFSFNVGFSTKGTPPFQSGSFKPPKCVMQISHRPI